MKKTILALVALTTALCAGAAGTNATCTVTKASLLGEELDTGVYGDGALYGLGASFLSLGLERNADGVSSVSPLLGLMRVGSYVDEASLVDVSLFSAIPPARSNDALMLSCLGNLVMQRMEVRGGMASFVNVLSHEAKASGLILGAMANWGLMDNALSGVCVGGLMNLVGLEEELDATSEALLRRSLGASSVELLKQQSGGGTQGTMKGIAVAGLCNAMKRADVSGAQVALLSNTAGTLDGVQIGCFNVAQGGSLLQVGVINAVQGPIKGVQIGLFNVYGAGDILPVLHVGF